MARVCVWSEEEVSKGNSIHPLFMDGNSNLHVPGQITHQIFYKPEQLIDGKKLLRLEVCRSEQVQSN
jgi:hypothetical protein